MPPERIRILFRPPLSRLLFGRRPYLLKRFRYKPWRAITLFAVIWLFTVPSQTKKLISNEYETFDGVYEFVSDEVKIQEPNPSTTTRNATDMAGLMIFKDGYYSETLMQKTRSTWASQFPRSAKELGFSSTAGTYEVQGRILRLKEDLSLYPLYVGRPVLLQFQRKGDFLILRENWEPHLENRSTGQKITTLRKIR